MGHMHGVGVAIADRTGGGYYVLDSHGDIFVFGDARVVRLDERQRLNVDQ
jgi:hypothetical protein